jgi:hypothetical protein
LEDGQRQGQPLMPMGCNLENYKAIMAVRRMAWLAG